MDTPSTEPGEKTKEASGGSFWALLALMITAAATLIVLQAKRSDRQANQFIGQPLPPLEVEGWINSQKSLAVKDLRGKVVLVDFWASDCGPCLEQLPELIEFNKRYRDQGVQIIGLSEESGQRAIHLRNLVETRPGLDWPIGYGAGFAYEVLSVYGTPTYILYDRDGRSVWRQPSIGGLEEAVVKLLAKK
jgi:thiol-disulfide isomerase/thioredoxin